MNKIKMKGLMSVLFIGLAFVTSCTKEDVKNPLDGVGSSYLRLDLLTGINDVIGWNIGLTAMDASPHTQVAYRVHRDAISNADLNKTVTVDFALDPTYLTTFNTAAQNVYDTAYLGDSTRSYAGLVDALMHFIQSDTIDGNAVSVLTAITASNYDSLHAANANGYPSTTFAIYSTTYVNSKAAAAVAGYAYATAPIQYEILPDTVYSWLVDGVPLTGNTLTFAAGQTTLELSIHIDPTWLSFTTYYALPLTLSNPSAGYKISGDNAAGAVGQSASQLINQIIVKNAYDGIYTFGPGTIIRLTGGVPNTGDPLMGDFTALNDATLITLGSNNVSFVPLWVGNGGIGGIGPNVQLTVDDAHPNGDGTFPVTVSDVSNSTMQNLPGEVNNYDPSTKTFTLAFHWGTANERKYWTKLVYKGVRP